MKAEELIETILMPLLQTSAPELIACLVVCILALVFWRQAPRASLWTILAFGILLVLKPSVHLGQHLLLIHGDRSIETRAQTMWFFQIGVSILFAVCTIFMLMAVFGGRSAPGRSARRLSENAAGPAAEPASKDE